MRRWSTAVLLALCASLIPAGRAAALSSSQSDSFDSDTQGWVVGTGQNPLPPTQVADGGPLGTGDGFLLLRSSGGFGPGSKLAVFNTSQWAGDYLAAGISGIRADLKNLGATDLVIHIQLEGGGGRFLSADGLELAQGSDWTSVLFPLDPASLVGAGTLSDTLSGVDKLWITHTTGVFPGDAIAAQLGVDNVTAVPEPSAGPLAGLGVALASWLRRRRG